MGVGSSSTTFLQFVEKNAQFSGGKADVQGGSGCCMPFLGGGSKTLSYYDLVLHTSQIQQVFRDQKGWPMTIGSPSVWRSLRDGAARPVGIVGVYNAGKTTLANMLTGRTVPVGASLHTVGVSTIVSGNLVYLDTCGQNQPLDVAGMDSNSSRDIVNGRSLGEQFSNDMVVELSEIIVVVVNQLTLEDQRLVHKLEAKQKEAGRQMIVVHNFKDSQTVDELNSLIEKDVVKGFGCVRKLWDGISYWQPTSSNTVHAVVAKVGSAAGKEQNQNTKVFLTKFLQGRAAGPNNGVGLLRGIDTYVQDNLWKVFEDRKSSNWSLMCSKAEGGLRLFVNCDSKRILNQKTVGLGTKYELDYELLQCKANSNSSSISHDIINIDVPGLSEQLTLTPVKEKKTIFMHEYSWGAKEKNGDGRHDVELTVRLVKRDGKGPSVDLQVYRKRDHKNVVKCVHDSGKHGEAKLSIELNSLCDAYSNAEVSFRQNSVLTVKLDRSADGAGSYIQN